MNENLVFAPASIEQQNFLLSEEADFALRW